jgi:hypothetical protein
VLLLEILEKLKAQSKSQAKTCCQTSNSETAKIVPNLIQSSKAEGLKSYLVNKAQRKRMRLILLRLVFEGLHSR